MIKVQNNNRLGTVQEFKLKRFKQLERWILGGMLAYSVYIVASVLYEESMNIIDCESDKNEYVSKTARISIIVSTLVTGLWFIYTAISQRSAMWKITWKYVNTSHLTSISILLRRL